MILTSTPVTILLISDAAIYGRAIKVLDFICRGAWRKYRSKFIVAVLIAGAALLSIISASPNVLHQTNREALKAQVGLSSIVII